MPPLIHSTLLKTTGVLAIFLTVLATKALISHLNLHYSWVAYFCGLSLILLAALSIYNTFFFIHFSPKVKVETLNSDTPDVAIIIPIYNESWELLKKTVESVLHQDYPLEHMKLLIANDGHQDDVSTFITLLQQTYPKLCCHEVLPPAKESIERQGEAKAGALNAAWEQIHQQFPAIEYVETRDCDDCVGDPQFLRKCTSYLMAHPTVGFVQTFKETDLGHQPDPFDTREVMLQVYQFPARMGLDGICSLGSGVVYRSQSLVDIGGFDPWNIVEDVTTSLRMLQKGWTSQILDIMGVYSQSAVNDLAIFLKQRSTWSLDAMRILLFFNKSGLTLKQKIAFCTRGIKDLIYPAAILLFSITISGSLVLGEPMFVEVPWIVPIAIAAHVLFSLTLFKGDWAFAWKSKILEWSLIFANIKMAWLAIVNGRAKKPRYVVTRKTSQHQSHLHHCRFHILWFVFILIGMMQAVVTGTAIHQGLFFIAAILWELRLIAVIALAFYKPVQPIATIQNPEFGT